MKKILWISSYPPTKESRSAGGNTLRYYFNAINSNKEFKITLLSLATLHTRQTLESEFEKIDHKFLYKESDVISKIKKIRNVDSIVNPYSKTCGLISNHGLARIKKSVEELSANGYCPDIIILEWTNIVILAKYVKEIYPQAKIIASEHDVTYIGFSRKAQYYRGMKATFWRIRSTLEKNIEIESLNLCDYIFPHNKDNISELVKEGIGQNKIIWLTPYFKNMEKLERNSNHRDILFYGAMSRKENYLSAIWFIENVMTKLMDSGLRFIILGSSPHESLMKYQCENIIVTGFVENIEPFFANSMCLVAPLLLGAGIKVKILEAFSSGIPVLTNAIGIEGIPAKDGIDYIHCENEDEYIDNIIRLKNDRLFTNKIEMNSKKFMKSISVEQSAKNYINILEQI